MITVAPEITAAIVAAICVLAIDKVHKLESKNGLRVAVATDIRAAVDLMQAERVHEPIALFEVSSSTLNAWDRIVSRIGDLPEAAVQSVVIFCSRLRGIVGIQLNGIAKAMQWRQQMSMILTACG